jgi:hypothetical protein
MERRAFVVGALGLLAAPLAADAQQTWCPPARLRCSSKRTSSDRHAD